MVRAKNLYEAVCAELKEISIDYIFEAQVLCKYILGFSLSDILVDKAEVDEKGLGDIYSAIQKRKDGYPIQYMVGEWDFYSLKFDVGEGVLIPRADTEVLVDAALKYAENKPKDINILDLCSGSGCVAIAVSNSLPNAKVFAVEKSEDAFKYLLKNIEKNNSNVVPILGDALCYSFSPEMQFDLIVSNPPYLTNENMVDLQKEVSFEPAMALFGGNDGLDFYRQLTFHWIKSIKKGGAIIYEVGKGQDKEVLEILKENGLAESFFLQDMCGINRVVGALLK